jgi:hypothetical protein
LRNKEIIVKYRIDFYKKAITKDGEEYLKWIEYKNTNSKNPEKAGKRELELLLSQEWRGLKEDDTCFVIKELQPWTKEELRKQLLY